MKPKTKNKILIIEDDPDVLILMKEYFEELGCTVLVSRDGSMGIHLALQEKPDLIITDVALPGENGLSVLNSIRSQQKSSNPPILLFTGMGDPDFIKKALSLGATAFFHKPEDISKLFKKTRNILMI